MGSGAFGWLFFGEYYPEVSIPTKFKSKAFVSLDKTLASTAVVQRTSQAQPKIDKTLPQVADIAFDP